jgi:hypothetical protein
MVANDGGPMTDDSSRRSLGRVLAAVWLVVSQVMFIGPLVFIIVMFSVGFFPFASVKGDPTFGFLSGVGFKGVPSLFGWVFLGGVVLGIVLGSWTLWAQRQHGRAVLVSSLPHPAYCDLGPVRGLSVGEQGQ